MFVWSMNNIFLAGKQSFAWFFPEQRLDTEPKGPVTLRNFLSNLSRNGWKCSVASCRGLVLKPRCIVQFSQQLVSQCYSEWKTTNCRKIARQVAEGVIHCAMVLSIAATDLLWKVELSSTSCNASRNKKIARQPMLHCVILQQLVSQRHCETSCWENCTV